MHFLDQVVEPIEYYVPRTAHAITCVHSKHSYIFFSYVFFSALEASLPFVIGVIRCFFAAKLARSLCMVPCAFPTAASASPLKPGVAAPQTVGNVRKRVDCHMVWLPDCNTHEKSREPWRHVETVAAAL